MQENYDICIFLLKEAAERPVQVVVMETVRADCEVIAAKEQKYSEIIQHQEDLQKKEREVNGALKKTQMFLRDLERDISKINNQIDEATNQQQKRISRKCWLMQLSESGVGENLEMLRELIEETDEAVAELSSKVFKLKDTLKENEKQLAKNEVQLIEKENEKKTLGEELKQLRVDKRSFQCILEEDRRQFQHKMEKLMLSHKHQLELERMNLSHEHQVRESQVCMHCIHNYFILCMV